MKIKFHVIDAVLNKGIDKAKCKVTSGNEVAINDGLTDHAGFITTNKITPGSNVHVQVTIEGYDDMDLEFVADEDKDFKMIVMNPTVSIIFYYNELHINIFTNLDNNFQYILTFPQSTDNRIVLTWGYQPSDLDLLMRFYDSEGNAVCSLHYKNKKCSSDYGDVYATLDVDQANVSLMIF